MIFFKNDKYRDKTNANAKPNPAQQGTAQPAAGGSRLTNRFMKRPSNAPATAAPTTATAPLNIAPSATASATSNVAAAIVTSVPVEGEGARKSVIGQKAEYKRET